MKSKGLVNAKVHAVSVLKLIVFFSKRYISISYRCYHVLQNAKTLSAKSSLIFS